MVVMVTAIDRATWHGCSDLGNKAVIERDELPLNINTKFPKLR
jgi:hypothetical protein